MTNLLGVNRFHNTDELMMFQDSELNDENVKHNIEFWKKQIENDKFPILVAKAELSIWEKYSELNITYEIEINDISDVLDYWWQEFIVDDSIISIDICDQQIEKYSDLSNIVFAPTLTFQQGLKQ